MITGVCAVLKIGFVVCSKQWDWMACRMLHDVSVGTQQDSVILGCDSVTVCVVPMLCGSTVYSSSRSDSSPWLLILKFKTLSSFEVLVYTHQITRCHILTDSTLQWHHSENVISCISRVFVGGVSCKWNFTVLLPSKRQSPFMLLCSANQEDQTHNYILFAANICLTLFAVA